MRLFINSLLMMSLFVSMELFAARCSEIEANPRSLGRELNNVGDKKEDFFKRIRKGDAISEQDFGKKGVKLLGIASEDNFGRSALTHACIYNNESAARVLLDHFKDNDKAAFYIREDGERKKARDVFINIPDVINEATALMYCAQFNSVKIAEMIIEDKFVRLDQRDRFGRSALMYAAFFGSPEIVKAIVKKDPNTVKAVDRYKHTAFYYAVQNNDNLEVLDLLSSSGGFDPEGCRCTTRKVDKHFKEQGKDACSKGGDLVL